MRSCGNCSYTRLKLAQLLGQLGVFLTCGSPSASVSVWLSMEMSSAVGGRAYEAPGPPHSSSGRTPEVEMMPGATAPTQSVLLSSHYSRIL
jgi:hypothetical protein